MIVMLCIMVIILCLFTLIRPLKSSDFLIAQPTSIGGLMNNQYVGKQALVSCFSLIYDYVVIRVFYV